MGRIRTVARRELNSFFNSAIALVFLLIFLEVTFIVFFTFYNFWAEGQAELRGFFLWLPMLLLFLVPALTMRLWSEEQKVGTLQMVLTLPVRIYEVVLGKFLASIILLCIALLFTISLPFTVAWLGDLDFGPSFGGYLAAVLLGAAYLAIGQFTSSLTENQILAFISALVICLVLWIVGEPWFVKFFPANWVELFSALGTGARFRSISRGVLDVRDLIYYLSIVVLFLFLNVAFLRIRKWS